MSETLEDHAKEWEALAESAERLASYYESRGEYGGVARNKADTYRRTATALRLEITTGKHHCVCCLSPDKGHGRPVP